MPYNDSTFTLHPVHPIQSRSLCFSILPLTSVMAAQLEVQKPRITEIQVRMDCNGCVQKIKRALHSINGIYDLYIDFPQQKITIVGWADPEKIVKAIKKTRKSAIICSHTEPSDPPAQPTEPVPEGGAPAEDSSNPPPAEAATPAEPPKDPPPPENLSPEVKPSPEAKPLPETAEAAASQPAEPIRPKEEVHVIHHYPPHYAYRYSYGQNISHGYANHTSTYPSHPEFRPEPPPPPPQYVTHSYNTHRPSPYVTQYEYIRSPPRYTQYSRPVPYSEDYNYHNGNNSNGNITSVFSDENPNACTIV